MSDELRVDSGALIFATLADVYISSGMIDEAISILKDGLARNPNYHLAHIILGRAHYLKGDIEEAKKTIESVYDAVKTSDMANLCLGHCYRDSGDKEKARIYYELALKNNPENMEALRELEKLIPDFELPKAKAQPAPVEPEVTVEEPVIVPVITEAEVTSVAPAPKVAEAVGKADEAEIVTIESVLKETPEKAPVVEAVPLSALDKPIKRLLSIETVKGVFISTKDGLLIKNYGKTDSDVEMICASVAAICLDVDESFRLLKRGGLTRCIIEKPDETLCVMTAGESLLTVITKVEAKPGLVFVYARKIIEEIEEILA